MPKLIPELRERFLDAARKRMQNGQVREMTIRLIAMDCQTAIGTVYNYFPSKRALMIAVMRQDWDACVRRMEAAAAQAEDTLSGLRDICTDLRGISQYYLPFWEEYDKTVSRATLNHYHDQVVTEMERPIRELLLRQNVLFDSYLSVLLSEMLMIASRTEDGFDRLRPILLRLLG